MLFRPVYLLGLFVMANSWAQPARQPSPSPVSAPKLVVGIVVDQMRADFLYRYEKKYGAGGFKRLLKGGFTCQNTQYDYALTATAAGHASIYSGSLPAIHGIVGNDWYDPSQAKGIYCVEDTSVRGVGHPNALPARFSPRNLLVTTIADQLALATNFRSKAVGIALKDRSAILSAGHSARGAYWFDSRTGTWVTSSFYQSQLPAWVEAFNARKLPAEYSQRGWKTLRPVAEYTESTPDDQPYEYKLPGKSTSSFPYEMAGPAGAVFELLTYTPWGNTLTKEMALAALKGENLGKGAATDFLAISFSTPDLVGHSFGPTSVEQEDIFLRLDAELADLLKALDSWVGPDGYTVFLTGDHGVMDVPAYWQAHHLPAGLIDPRQLSQTLNQSLLDAFGPGNYVQMGSMNDQLYLNQALLREKNLSVSAVQQALQPRLTTIPGVADLVNLRALAQANLPDEQLRLYKNSYHARRSGDLQLIYQPGWFVGLPIGTTHGSAYTYDRQVPCIFYGWGIRRGETRRPTSPSDIAPTLSALLRMLPPSGTTGQPVGEALQP
ncbi:alkaline phosphatase PafA [Spirosoma validum]|uniref:Alkaline phosphatase family protein n=1 Tax=Spirosoma validum TaxID=2771355 RepID=A0A927GH20_9BACT|nr:alkaline phosphatase PafA [Spirosoma validum]MBD2757479.1 alkaline phosphatase family protein [Spirosoma validum]